ncbi:acyltransferase family protein [Paenibacillus tarimensis]|uniref:acyltransferase family protein n=1 Tax=Paenibacillus tarimensis TaxID=416012 RepID=UPI001F415AB4|nr:acyltransferase family protein [Paenibacillus tarimensis]MCF2943136.1 acyltransferase [Paenibacillus tarimensis]
MDLYKRSERKFRTEIEGLRAVAAILVAVYHIWLGNVSGGVDVFFVVSGFLITTSLLSRWEKYGKIDAAGFLLNLCKRLFPAAFTVLFLVSAACFLWLPELRWDQTVKEVMASAFYLENWQLARNSVDYLAQNNEASPFQHFWAMSVQGQFYMIWPILLSLSLILAKRVFKKTVRFSFLAVLLGVFVMSFAYSVYLTAINQPWAYFDTFTRVWEFTLGGIVALLIANIKLNRTSSLLFGWLGLAGLVSCGIILQVSTVFPGYAALWPTLSAVCILLAGNQGGSAGVHRLLSSKPLVGFGSISYGFYLWHWPLLIFYYILFDKESINFLHGLVIIVAASVLSYITTSMIEKPIRNSLRLNTNWKISLVAASFMVAVLAISAVWYGTIKYLQSGVLTASAASDEYPGAAVMGAGAEGIGSITTVSYIPRPIQARKDLPKVYEDNCHQAEGKAEVLSCTYGVKDNPRFTIALVGGSHSAQWLPALEEIADEEKLKIVNYSKSSCRFTADDTEKEDCRQWNESLIEMLTKQDIPDLVFTTANVGKHLKDDIPAGFIKQWGVLKDAKVSVFAVRDNPWFEFDPPTCVDENGPNASECMVKRELLLPEPSAWSRLENPPANVHYADFSDYFCDEEHCGPVIGNVLVYRDKHHITGTYMKTLAPILREHLMPVLEQIES